MDLSLLQTLLLCGLVLLGGFVDSIAGGGGLITLPAYFAVGLPAHLALGTNKFSGCLGTLAAVLRYQRAGTMRWRIGLLAALGALPGSALGARLALWVPAAVLHGVLLVLVPALLVLLLFKNRLLPTPARSPGGPVPGAGWKAAAIGGLVGVYDGFFGPGTGTLLALGFATLLGLDLLTASANARLANLASNAGSLAVFLVHGQVLFPLALATAASGIAGNWLGSRFAVRKGEKLIRPLMVVVLILLLIEVARRLLDG